jgi:hypothetical protein
VKRWRANVSSTRTSIWQPSRVDSDESMKRIATVLAFALPVVIAVAVTLVLVRRDDDDEPHEEQPAPMSIASNAPRFTDLDGLVAASGVIVLAEVTGTSDGRTITDPKTPAAGVRTRLVELRVVDSLSGKPPRRVVVEEEAALLDGTPIVVDGVAPVRVGDRGVFFLVAGGSEASPHYALVGPQGRYLVEDDALAAAIDDPLAIALARDGGPALVDAVRERVKRDR